MALPGTGNVNRGLQVFGGRAFATADAFNAVQVLGVDDNASNFAATDTAENTRGALVNFAKQAFDATPTRSGQTISCTTTLATGTANFTIKGIALHNDIAANVTASSTTLIAGIAGQSIVKTSSFTLAITVSDLFTDNS